MFEAINYKEIEPYIDFTYTTLLMMWGGSLVGIGMLAIPLIFQNISSRDEASELTVAILNRQNTLIRVIVLCMLVLFLLKRNLNYQYQYFEWGVYVIVLHFYIFGRIFGKRLNKQRDKVDSFDSTPKTAPERKKFSTMHMISRYLYIAQFIGVVILLYLHATGL